MNLLNRRGFFRNAGAGFEALAAAELQPNARPRAVLQDQPSASAIDFRYSPLSGQTSYCFPDDRHKSLIGDRGELRCGHPGQGKGIDYFPVIVQFSLRGMEADTVTRQVLEAPGVPIVHTHIERPEAFLELTTFATNRADEGRVDNVILEVRPRTRRNIHAGPRLVLRTGKVVSIRRVGPASVVLLGEESTPPFLVADSTLSRLEDAAHSVALSAKVAPCSAERPVRCFFRFPQEGQDFERLQAGLSSPGDMLAEARSYWRNWRPFAGRVAWKLTGRHDDFLVGCARNILQAREMRDGKLTFQVGPTVYRGLWVVDGHFILEAGRYLGYDAEAQLGLEATWARQETDGGIFAGGGKEHWKDTGIAMFTLVRQAELSQDWDYFREMRPNLQKAIRFLMSLRDRARTKPGANGQYGLLAQGMGDGGLGGIRSEFTNTLWVLAGLKSVTEAAERLGLGDFESANQFYRELRASFFAAARQEMRRHPGGFDFLPMLMKDDAQWSADDEWDRPRPQVAQWALSHAVYPGLVFDRADPIVKGHISLMQACVQEDIPAETGWLPHEGAWNYNAAFVAHVYLWADLPDWARLTFTGFLNHATPLYCWREEQPIRGSLVSSYVGDMPHNWASAECILYLRHMMALEDGMHLRLLCGLGDPELSAGEPLTLDGSPTRFGRVSLKLEPLGNRQGLRLKYSREGGPAPKTVQLPPRLTSRFGFSGITGAGVSGSGDKILVSPEATSWTAAWK